MNRAAFSRLVGSAARLWRDTDGIILPYATVMLTVFVGMSALAIDATRFMSLQTQLQKAADAAAIAGAAELDRLTTSTTRATRAINNLLINSDLFTGQNVQISTIRFLSSLPASDNTAIGSGNVTCSGSCTNAQSVASRFVEVTVTPVTMPTIFPVSYLFGSAANSVTTGAQAVAGYDGVSCGLTPMFVCNPYEQAGDPYDLATWRLEQANADPTTKRKLLKLRDSDNNAGTWGPGDFGYLTPEPGTLPNDGCFSGTSGAIATAMAADRPQICVRQNGVDLQPGNTTNGKDGLNTRFGLYSNSTSATCRANYPPDLNVRKAYIPGGGPSGTDWCTADADGQTNGANPQWPNGQYSQTLGVDSCFLTNSCSPANIGAASWDCQTYWNTNHASSGAGAPAGCGTAATTTISRYDVYQDEINRGLLNDTPTTQSNLLKRETAAPQCNAAAARANRRIMYVAIINCASSPVTIQSNAQNVPVAAFAKVFLTVPVPNSGTPYAEFLGLVERGDGVIFDQVQLYR